MATLLRPLRVGLAALTPFAGSLAAAQTSAPETRPVPVAGVITGIISDSAGIGISGAHVSMVGLASPAYTDQDGGFRLQGIAVGDHRLVARRIGFYPETLMVAMAGDHGSDVHVHLRAAALRIAPVVIAARSRNSGPLAGFYDRAERGNGHFFTAEDIDKRRPRVVTDLLRTLPGTHLNYVNGQQVVTFRGMRCPPLIWVDGAPATAGYLDPDLFVPQTLAGIEVYPGPASVPAELTWVRGKSTCGVIAMWTKRPEASARPAQKVSAEGLTQLIESMRLYTADGVDTPAAADSAHPVRPAYPDSLFRAAIGGRVVVEFVVDIDGKADMGTFGAVLSTNGRFTDAVRQAVTAARFTPAWLGGRRVRQLVQLPFTFEPPRKSGMDSELPRTSPGAR